MDELILYAAVALVLVVAVLVSLVVSQRERMKRFDAKLGMSGVGLTVELHDLVKQEVARISLASLGRLARVDRELIDFWEQGQFLTSEDSTRRLGLIQSEVAELEKKFRAAPAEDKYHLALQLRELYWKWLDFGRLHFASSVGYQQIRQQVMAGLDNIEQVGFAGDEG